MIKQFTINLNKGEGEVILKQRRQERRSYLVLGLFGLMCLVLGGLTWAQTQAMRDVVKSRQQKLDRIKFELDSLKREGTKVSKEDVSALARLENERFLWARRLEVLAEIMPEHVAITGIDFQNKVMKIAAIAQVDSNVKEFELIANFIDLLKGTPDFRQGLFTIKFDQSQRKEIEGQDVLIFTVQCLTTDPDQKRKVAQKKDTPVPGTNF
jgi:Tfp pilus assembly protein PilN